MPVEYKNFAVSPFNNILVYYKFVLVKSFTGKEFI